MSFSEKIIKLRIRMNWSQSELARRSGITASSISQMESGDRNPTLRSLNKLSNAFGVNIQELTEDRVSVNEFNIFMNKFNQLTHKERSIVENIVDYLIEY